MIRHVSGRSQGAQMVVAESRTTCLVDPLSYGEGTFYIASGMQIVTRGTKEPEPVERDTVRYRPGSFARFTR
jgi:hypothetical protein